MKEINNKSSFSAIVNSPFDGDFTVDVELPKSEFELTYDEVEDAIFSKIPDTINIDEDSPIVDECQIVDLVINVGDESYPVISEDQDDTNLKNDKAFTKYLVLPWARYELTAEAKLWMNLKKNGILDEDAPFDFEKYHKMVENNNG